MYSYDERIRAVELYIKLEPKSVTIGQNGQSRSPRIPTNDKISNFIATLRIVPYYSIDNMPTILSHPAIPLGLAIALGPTNVSRKLLSAGVVASILPDLDVIGFRLGIDYSHALGHRGFTHSLVFAIGVAIVAAILSNRLKSRPLTAFAFVFVACASHSLLDMLTNGGLGIALFWPLSEDRFFWPVQVIEVSPLNLHRFFGPAGWNVLGSEFRWVWLPAAALAATGYAFRRFSVLGKR